MATISFTIPEDYYQTMLDKFADYKGWTTQIQQLDEDGNIETIDNPVSKLQFMKSDVMQYIKDCIERHNKQQSKLSNEPTIESELNDIYDPIFELNQ